MKQLTIAIALILTAATAQAQQSRVYDSKGNSVGTIVPQSDGTNRYYDSRGNSLGTSTTSPNGTTTFYGPDGRKTGTTTRSGAGQR